MVRPKNHKAKVKIAHRFYLNQFRGIPKTTLFGRRKRFLPKGVQIKDPFQTDEWEERKESIADRVKRKQVIAHNRALERQAKLRKLVRG